MPDFVADLGYRKMRHTNRALTSIDALIVVTRVVWTMPESGWFGRVCVEDYHRPEAEKWAASVRTRQIAERLRNVPIEVFAAKIAQLPAGERAAIEQRLAAVLARSRYRDSR